MPWRSQSDLTKELIARWGQRRLVLRKSSRTWMVKAMVGRCGAQGMRPSPKKAAATLESPWRRLTRLCPEAGNLLKLEQ